MMIDPDNRLGLSTLITLSVYVTSDTCQKIKGDCEGKVQLGPQIGWEGQSH